MHRSVFLVVAFLLGGCGSLARDKQIDDTEYEAQSKPAPEIEAQLPPYPQPGNLVLVDAGSATANKFYIDASSIAIGADAVVRYAMVTKAAGGATNVSYEGIRCETREQKVYAFGSNNGTWIRTRDPQWQRIVLRDLKPYPFVLYREFFCASGPRPVPVRQAVDALRRGVGLAQSRETDQ